MTVLTRVEWVYALDEDWLFDHEFVLLEDVLDLLLDFGDTLVGAHHLAELDLAVVLDLDWVFGDEAPEVLDLLLDVGHFVDVGD